MGKETIYGEREYKAKNDYEKKFISDIMDAYDGIFYRDIEAQKNALKNVIEYIKIASKEGKTVEQIENLVLYNITNLYDVIQYPTLTNFYQMRTLEYMMGADLNPYIDEILESKIDVIKFQKNHKNGYSANVRNNVMVELCGIISDFTRLENCSTDSEYDILRQKIKNNELTMDDKALLSKYIRLYLNEMKFGKSSYWDEQRKDIEECRKLLLKYKDQIFNVETVTLSNMQTSDELDKVNDTQHRDAKSKMESIKQFVDQKSDSLSMGSGLIKKENNISQSYQKVTLRKFVKKPFISNNKLDNFFIIMNDLLSKIDEDFLEKMYTVLLASENSPVQDTRELCKEAIYSFFKGISYKKNLMHAKDHLSERLCAIISFYKATGMLDELCKISNNRLAKINLKDLKIDPDSVFSKFINDQDLEKQYFIHEDDDYSIYCKGTTINFSSDEAIIGMSAFYTNRMAKQMPTFARLRYILDKKDAIRKICENPNIEFEDLKYTDEELARYMSVYMVMQDIMLHKYFYNVDEDECLYEEKVYEDLSAKLKKYKAVYEKYYSGMGFDFYKDLTTIMMDAQIMSQLYELKEFSVKSLLYTAITDQNKNIINWGYVPEDDCSDEKFALIGFDIKTLNSPIFVHIRKEDLIKFLKELTGDCKIRIYEGANDMYSYTIKQRVTTQVLYPLSKDEKKKLLKLDGKVTLTDYYKHIRWLQQSNNLPALVHAPGSREYNMETGEITKIKQQKQDQDDIKNNTKSKGKSKNNQKGKKKKSVNEDYGDR